MFLLASSNIITEEETLIYDMISFVSEFGGSLGLFLGFSFFMLASYVHSSIIDDHKEYLKAALITLLLSNKRPNLF